jgi:AcrR family transcriptional regulator/DNA-binding MarR family transcriptional regulator
MRSTAKPRVRRPGGVRVRVRDGEVSQMQRARLLGAAIPVVNELGWSGVTVADIASRARVSRRTFYDLFANREDCLLAVFEDMVARVEQELAAADLQNVSWLERVRTGLWTILCFLDSDRALARVCVVQSARGAQRVLEAREDLLSRLAGILERGGGEGARECPPPLVAEGLVGAATAIVYKRLLTGDRAPLSELQGELMGMIVLPYLGPAAASRERKRRVPKFPKSAASRVREGMGVAGEDALQDVPMRLTYRTARVLEVTAQYPGANNREIGELAGIHDQGQVSKLLARLLRLGLLENKGEGQAKGEPNAWCLTPLGERVAQQLSLGTDLAKDTVA